MQRITDFDREKSATGLICLISLGARYFFGLMFHIRKNNKKRRHQQNGSPKPRVRISFSSNTPHITISASAIYLIWLGASQISGFHIRNSEGRTWRPEAGGKWKRRQEALGQLIEGWKEGWKEKQRDKRKRETEGQKDRGVDRLES